MQNSSDRASDRPSDRIEQALQRFQEAYQAQMEGDYDRAVELYRGSIALHPTAEAHTFLGWTFHFQGKIAEAIDECKRAIEVDPEFGNPYNDIGAYSKWGEWGALESFMQPTTPLTGAPPKWQALQNFISGNPCWWSGCSGNQLPTAPSNLQVH